MADIQALLDLAAHGRGILPLYGVLPLEGADGGYFCACGRLDCASPGKHPYPFQRQRGAAKRASGHDSTTDPALIESIFEDPALNAGMVTDGLCVLDIDDPAAWPAFLAKNGEMPVTKKVITARGFHLYLRAPPGMTFKSCKLAPGIETRGAGGYVVTVGSRHVSGHVYRWAGADDV